MAGRDRMGGRRRKPPQSRNDWGAFAFEWASVRPKGGGKWEGVRLGDGDRDRDRV